MIHWYAPIFCSITGDRTNQTSAFNLDQNGSWTPVFCCSVGSGMMWALPVARFWRRCAFEFQVYVSNRILVTSTGTTAKISPQSNSPKSPQLLTSQQRSPRSKRFGQDWCRRGRDLVHAVACCVFQQTLLCFGRVDISKGNTPYSIKEVSELGLSERVVV